jgi:hypothetical protein
MGWSGLGWDRAGTIRAQRELSYLTADQALMAPAAMPNEALAQLKGTLAGKTQDETFPPAG